MNRSYAVTRLREKGWAVEVGDTDRFRIPAEVAARHPRIPPPLAGFLSGLLLCEDASQTTWFLCEADYCGESGAAFRWDEWERMSLEASCGDEGRAAKIRGFWDDHLPFMLSVRDGYSYRAVRTTADGFGQVVSGREPEFEEASVVAESFEQFMAELLERGVPC